MKNHSTEFYFILMLLLCFACILSLGFPHSMNQVKSPQIADNIVPAGFVIEVMEWDDIPCPSAESVGQNFAWRQQQPDGTWLKYSMKFALSQIENTGFSQEWPAEMPLAIRDNVMTSGYELSASPWDGNPVPSTKKIGPAFRFRQRDAMGNWFVRSFGGVR